MVGHGLDGTEGLGRLRVGHDLTVEGVDTGGILVLTIADLEHSRVGDHGAVVHDTNTIIDVLAE